MLDSNPTQIQFARSLHRDTAASTKCPLILIHDGGGTTFGYYSLKDLGSRNVYCIHNPNFTTATPWAGGIPSMAEHYITLIQRAGIAGPVILGGWSLGGLLSFAIAHALAHEGKYKRFPFWVKGMVMIDTPFQVPWTQLPEVSPVPVSHLPELVRKSLELCKNLLWEYSLPSWTYTTPTLASKKLRILSGEHLVLDHGSWYHKAVDGQAAVHHVTSDASWEKSSSSDAESQLEVFAAEGQFKVDATSTPPPCVLIKAIQRVLEQENDIPCARVDHFRAETLLGWDRYPVPFIKAVIDFDSHHYNAFDFSKTDALSDKMNEALHILDDETEM